MNPIYARFHKFRVRFYISMFAVRLVMNRLTAFVSHKAVCDTLTYHRIRKDISYTGS